MSYLLNKPLTILRPNSQIIKGKEALRINIEAITAISYAIRTTLGPKGLNKMIVDTLGDVTITGDGAKILEEIGVENPAAKMIVDLSKAIKKSIGDGTSSSVIFIPLSLTLLQINAKSNQNQLNNRSPSYTRTFLNE